MWPDERIVRYVTQNFIAARVHVKDPGAAFMRFSERFKAPWTPTILILDSEGVEQHRVEGFLPADDLLAQLMLSRAKMAFQRQQWAAAQTGFREIVDRLPNTDAAAEALYWAGAAGYKATGDPSALQETGRAFKQRYQTTTWAKKASVWG